MKKLVLLLSLVAFVATGAFAQTLNPTDVCPGNNTPTITGGAFTINIAGTGTGQPLAFATTAVNDEGVCGLTTVEYNGGVEVSCNGVANGSITVNITGGNAPYRYTLYQSIISPGISDFGQIHQDIVSSTTNVFSGLAGDAWYYVTVEQTNGTAGNFGCLISTLPATPTACTGAIYLDQPEKVTATYCQVPDYCQANTASVTLNIQGGVQFYTVTWAAGTAIIPTTPPAAGAAAYSSTPYGLPATSVTGQGSAAATVGVQGPLVPSPVTADNLASGQDHDAYDNVQTVTITGLTGNYPYDFTITDANGCAVQNP